MSQTKTYDFVIAGGGRHAAAERGAPRAGIALEAWMRTAVVRSGTRSAA